MQPYESRLSYFNDKPRINYCKSPSVHQHGGPLRPRQNCHSCIFETKENSNLRICIQYLGHHSKTTCQKSAKSMRYRVRPKFEFYRKSLLNCMIALTLPFKTVLFKLIQIVRLRWIMQESNVKRAYQKGLIINNQKQACLYYLRFLMIKRKKKKKKTPRHFLMSE